MEKRLRPPLTYYGGKQTLAPLIVSLIPDHVLYGEPFLGGGAVFFRKPPSQVEVVNDTNGELMNFYRVTRDQFEPLQRLVRQTLHSRDAFHKAEVVYHHPDLFDPVRRAWAVWVLCSLAFSSRMDGPFGFDKTDNTSSKRTAGKRENFMESYAQRLEKVQIECADALYVIQSRDHKDAFFYCDPPYIGSNQGHYKGYTEADFVALLRLLSRIKGKFLLSSYPSEILSRFTENNGWHYLKRELYVTVNLKGGNPKRKTEVLTANYPLAAS